MIERVMLINPSNTIPNGSIRRLSPPLGILYIAGELKKYNYKINILDSCCEGYFNTTVSDDNHITYGLSDKDFIKRVERFKPDVVGISSLFSAHQQNVIRHCDMIKSVDKDITTVLGGIHPSLFPVETLKNPSVDYVILGEGEYRFKKLLDFFEGKEFPFDGVAWKNNNKIKVNPMTTRIEDLDGLEYPARDLVEFERYMDIGVPYAPFPRKERTAQLQSSRGCPFSCVFCSTTHYWGHKFRKRSVDNIMKEIDLLVDKYNIQEIQFTDDNMTIHRDRAMELFKRLKDYDLSWCTPHGLMMKTLDKEMIKAMAESGAYQLTVAIESGSRRVREQIIHKSVPPRNWVKKMITEAHKYDIQIHGLFVTGFPGESRSEMEQTFKYPYYVDFDSVSFFIAVPMPGSELHTQCKEKGYISESPMMNMKDANLDIPVDSPDYVMSRKDLTELVDRETIKYNEYIKKKFPGRWEQKFEQFLKKHGDQSDLILGRVT